MDEFQTYNYKRVTSIKQNNRKEAFDNSILGVMGCNDKCRRDECGNTICTYYGFSGYNSFVNYFKNRHFIQLILSGAPFPVEFISEKFLCSISWDDDFIYVVFYETKEQLMETVRCSLNRILKECGRCENWVAEVMMMSGDEILRNL